MAEDYYRILGLKRNASQNEVKQAFRKLAREYHPDITDGDKAKAEHFKKIAQSYDTLFDEEKRRNYDLLRIANASSEFTRPLREGVDQAFNRFVNLAQDVLDQKRKSPTKSNIDVVETKIAITLGDAYTGVLRELSFQAHKPCVACAERGWPKDHPPLACDECQGGKKTSTLGSWSLKRTCKKCEGAGHILTHVCQKCGGQKTVETRTTIAVQIPAGIEDQTRLRVNLSAIDSKKEIKERLLFVCVTIANDPRFVRNKLDITTSASVGISSLLLGSRILIDLPAGRLWVNIPRSTSPDNILRIKGHGFESPTKDLKGDLYIKIKLTLPQEIPASAETSIRQLARTLPGF